MTRNFFYTILLTIVNILFPIFSFPYASRILGPVGIGKVQFIVSLTQYFAMFAAIGIPIYGITQAAINRDDPKKLSRVFAELTTIFFISSVLLSAVYLIIIYSFPFFFKDRLYYIYGGSLILFSFCYTDWFYTGIEAFRIIALRSIIVKSIALGLLYTFIKSEADFLPYLLVILFSILGNQLFSFGDIARKVKFRWKDLYIKKHLKPLFFIFSAGIAASIYTILDTVLLGFLSNEKSVGLYTASVKLIRITFPFVTALGVILMPSISKNFSSNKLEVVEKLHQDSFSFLTIFSIPVSLGLGILAPECILVFSGQGFIQAIPSMRILAILPILVGLGHFFHLQILIPAGRNKEVFYSMLSGVFICLFLNYLLVPTLRENGAAIATVVTEIVVTCIYAYYIKKYFQFNYNWKLIRQSVICVIPFIPIIILIRQLEINAITTLILSGIVCSLLYFCLHIYLFKNPFLNTFKKSFIQRFLNNNSQL